MKFLKKNSRAATQSNLILSIVILATLSRLAIPAFLGHLPNFSALNAIALFCGAYFTRRLSAIIVVLFSVWVGDLFINKMLTGQWNLFYSGFYWQYGSYTLITLTGVMLVDKVTALRVLFTCLSASLLFFIISNFGTWTSGYLYPMTFNGLIACYVAAIPFFKHTVFSDLFFSAALFGSIEFVRHAATAQKYG